MQLKTLRANHGLDELFVFLARFPIDQCPTREATTDRINQVLDLISGPDYITLDFWDRDVARLKLIDYLADRLHRGNQVLHGNRPPTMDCATDTVGGSGNT